MDIRDRNILGQFSLGFEMEFFCDRPRAEIAKEIANLLRKKVVVGDSYHSEKPIGEQTFYLEPDYSGGTKMHELITAPMNYWEAITVNNKIISWIRDNGWTDEKCAVQFTISIDNYKTDLKEKLQFVNKLKFILGFDEDFVYEKFPTRRNSQYARSIKQILPINKFIFNDTITDIHKENYILPNEKYYGINFTKLNQGLIEVRYCGGRGYEKKCNEFVEIINYVCKYTYEVLSDNNRYSDEDIGKLRKVLREHKKVVSSFSDLDMFFANYPNIKVFVDLRGDRQVLKTYYPQLREQLFSLIINCGMKKGLLNYDADAGKYQLKNAIIGKSFPLKDMEVFDSKISGNIINCDLYRCVITNSHILDCNLYQGNVVAKSKVINSPIHLYNQITDSYIDNKKLLVNGKIEGGVIRSGEIAPTAKISKETEVIEQVLKGENKDDKGAANHQGKRLYMDKNDKGMPSNIGGTKLTINKL